MSALVIMSGLPGSGKSSVAARIARFIDAEWIAADLIREQLVPLAVFGAEAKYGPEASRATFAVAELRASLALRAGRNAILDGTYLRPIHRAQAVLIAHRLALPALLVKVVAPDSIVRSRLERRVPGDAAGSEASVAIYDDMKRRLEARAEDMLDLELDAPADPVGRPVPTVVIDNAGMRLRVVAVRDVPPGSVFEPLLAAIPEL